MGEREGGGGHNVVLESYDSATLLELLRHTGLLLTSLSPALPFRCVSVRERERGGGGRGKREVGERGGGREGGKRSRERGEREWRERERERVRERISE